MTLYRRKPVEIEMIQWNGDNLDEIRAWSVPDRTGIHATQRGGFLRFLCIKSNSNPQIPLGDWVARERDGHGFYPIANLEQAQTYEAVDPPAVVPTAEPAWLDDGP